MYWVISIIEYWWRTRIMWWYYDNYALLMDSIIRMSYQSVTCTIDRWQMYHTVAIDSMYDMHLRYHVLSNVNHWVPIHQWQQSLHRTSMTHACIIIGNIHHHLLLCITRIWNTSVTDDMHSMHYELINDATWNQRCHATNSLNSLNPLRCITSWWWSKAWSCYIIHDGCVRHTRWIDNMHRPLVYDGCIFMDGSRGRCRRTIVNPCDD